jgi:sodium/pantothenate symporter
MLFSWIVFFIYVVVTLYLAWLGSKRTKSLDSFAIGNRDLNPWIVGITLAASMTSTATFVINPGIVYATGWSAIMGYGVSAGIGLISGIIILSKGFRRYGVQSAALTVPQWIGSRYQDRRLTLFYAVVSLFMIAMVVLICYAISSVLVATLNLPALFGAHSFEIALAITIVFVFTYIMFGGTYAHAYTNTAQGLIMIVVAVALIASGIHLIGGGLLGALRDIDPNLAAVINPNSILFRNYFEVFGANFVVGFALAVQPHFITKSLYVKRDKDVNLYLVVTCIIGVLFSMVLLCGLFARIKESEFITQFITANKMGIDGVMPAYILKTFSPVIGALISLAILAAGMSTLDGILVALSAIFANDIYLVLSEKRLQYFSQQEKLRIALKAGRFGLIGLGILAYILSLLQHHYKEFSVAIFAQEGVYALFAATFVPLLFGMFKRDVHKVPTFLASVSALVIHFGFRYGKLTLVTPADYTNPGLTATYGLLFSVAVMLTYTIGRTVFTKRSERLSL